MAIINICNKIIEYSFYALFFLVPLFFTSNTFELFEFNKMWLTFAITLVIAGTWGTKMILEKRILFQRTPLDIPIALFLLSQIISTIFSLDPHVSLWGYYSRFNGGLLSIISYIFLYYAFVSNFNNEQVRGGVISKRGVATSGGHHAGAPALLGVWETRGAASRQDPAGTGPAMAKRLLGISLASGLIVALWGLPSHFGHDPTCLLFRGTFDVSCWTESFQPRVRIFSTLGQPNWLAAYLAILLPLALANGINVFKSIQTSEKKNHESRIMNYGSRKNVLLVACYLLLVALFYVALIFSGSRSGFYGLVVGLFLFVLLFAWNSFKSRTLKKNLILITPIFVVIAFLSLYLRTPSTPQIKQFIPQKTIQEPSKSETESLIRGPALETGGTESGNIRLIVWKGAIEAWKNNPIFGTGVETFAFAYYKYRPKEHNLTSEWDFLYNKAHNEYLNYLTTTGIFGLGSYLLMIGWFILNVILNPAKRGEGSNEILRFAQNDNRNIILALIAAYLSILVSNFLGFSVVIVNLYLFLIPAFVFILLGMLPPQNESGTRLLARQVKNYELSKTSYYQWLGISFLLIAFCLLLITLYRFWQADTRYALGYNLDRAREYQMAYPELLASFQTRQSEPVFLDELAFNNAMMSILFINQKDATTAASFAQNALELSNKVTLEHPNNIVFWKTRSRILYAFSQLDAQYTPLALNAIQKANILAPTDAKISYNLGVLYGQTGNVKKGVEVLEETVRLKPNYLDAYYALGLFYHELKNDKKAVETMNYILNNLDPKNEGAKTALKSWGL